MDNVATLTLRCYAVPIYTTVYGRRAWRQRQPACCVWITKMTHSKPWSFSHSFAADVFFVSTNFYSEYSMTLKYMLDPKYWHCHADTLI